MDLPHRFRQLLLPVCVLLTGLLAAALPGCDSQPAEAAEITLTVEGMSCAENCAPAVQAALARVDGVESVSVDFEHKTAVCRARGVSADDLIAALPQRFTASVKE